jgi:hypothetical protein
MLATTTRFGCVPTSRPRSTGCAPAPAWLRRGRLSGVAEIAGPIDELLNRIVGFGSELTIVLDDLQTVMDGDVLASIDYASSVCRRT